MRYGDHVPRSSQVANQVDQNDPVNEVVRDAFGFQDDNFTAEVQGAEHVFFRNDAAQLDENVNLEDADDTDDQIRMIPTSEEVIQALNQMKLEEDADIDIDSNQKNEYCCICLEDFCDIVEVSTLPCRHVFHYNCVVQWLKTSHMCPLCRYPMPIGDDS
ncbi:hypothetical protein K1719_028367 [Acacia pycnantha]|nr:hypothetical protein K1719_028367 [Acacia pycnantha]